MLQMMSPPAWELGLGQTCPGVMRWSHEHLNGKALGEENTAATLPELFRTQLGCYITAYEKQRWTQNGKIPSIVNCPIILEHYYFAVTLTSL